MTLVKVLRTFLISWDFYRSKENNHTTSAHHHESLENFCEFHDAQFDREVE